MQFPIQSISNDPGKPDFHAVSTIQLGELLTDGWINWQDESWSFPSYNEEQHTRLCALIEGRYFYREIGVLPPGRWKMLFLQKLNEIMPKYIPLYEAIDQGANPLQNETRYGKSRLIHSDYPVTQLSGNSDYSSYGDDRQYEDVVQGDFLAKSNEIANAYRTVDVMILDELDTLFSSLITENLNVW